MYRALHSALPGNGPPLLHRTKRYFNTNIDQGYGTATRERPFSMSGQAQDTED
jgi:hypothetical protein